MALQLLEITTRGIRFVETTLAILKARMKPVVVISILGQARTGKSFLLNKLAGNGDFEVQTGSEPTTKGVWIMILDHPVKEGCDLILMDTEALGDTEQVIDKLDGILFTINYMISSALVYNVMRDWKQSDLDLLSCFTYLKEVKPKEMGPNLIVTVRDSISNTEDDEYFEGKLNSDQGKKNIKKMKKNIKRYFPTRKCFTFDTPAMDLKQIREDTLKKKFTDKLECFTSHIHHNIPGKLIRGCVPMTGKAMANLIKRYVDHVYKKNIMDYSLTATDLLERERIKHFQKEAVIFYCKVLAEDPEAEGGLTFSEADRKARVEAIKYFDMNIVDAEEKSYQKLEKRFDEERDSCKNKLGYISHFATRYKEAKEQFHENPTQFMVSVAATSGKVALHASATAVLGYWYGLRAVLPI